MYRISCFLGLAVGLMIFLFSFSASSATTDDFPTHTGAKVSLPAIQLLLFVDGNPYQWLCRWQNSGTGLLPSQEDNTASTYNNALAAMVFLLNNNVGKAERILDYYKSRFNDLEFFLNGAARGFYQYRNSRTGVPNTTTNRWMGDNAWLLMAISHYKKTTGKTQYDQMAAGIANLLLDFQQPGGCIASGWEWDGSGEVFRDNCHTEGNIDAYAALKLFGTDVAALNVKQWLDYTNLDWKYGPLDIHSWRVLSLGSNYGFSLNHAHLFRRTLNYKGIIIEGFVPSDDDSDFIWAEGTGGMILAFDLAGYKGPAELYRNELTKLIFASTTTPGTRTLPYLVPPGVAGYPWVDVTKGHVAAVCWYLFVQKSFNPFTLMTINTPQPQNPVIRIQAENYDGTTGLVQLDSRGIIYEGETIHIADSGNTADADEHSAEYQFRSLSDFETAKLVVRYADDIAGDTCEIHIDNHPVHSFDTEDTGTWDDFVVTGAADIGNISKGEHTLLLKCTNSGSYGLTVDMIEIIR
jgi:hypothetical protein